MPFAYDEHPDVFRLKHMLDMISEVDVYKVRNRESLITIRASERALEIIGEAANHISRPLIDAHPEVPWHEIRGLRNRLIHEYFDTDTQILWSVVDDELPQLKIQLQAMLQEISDE